jgi:hypothetical protein
MIHFTLSISGAPWQNTHGTILPVLTTVVSHMWSLPASSSCSTNGTLKQPISQHEWKPLDRTVVMLMLNHNVYDFAAAGTFEFGDE